MMQIPQNEYTLTYTNSQGDKITPLFPVPEYEMAKFVEGFQAEARFIRFNVIK